MKRATETPKGGSCKACGGKAHKYWSLALGAAQDERWLSDDDLRRVGS